MGRTAENVYTDPRDIERIESLVTQLPSQARVRITLRNGKVVVGTVTERPAAQLYENAAGHAGVNAELRLDDPLSPPWTAYLWLDAIEHVEPLVPQN